MTIERIPITSREQWLAARAGNIGASEIAALFAEHPYTTAYELFAKKSGIIPNLGPDSTVLKRGRILEAAIPAAVIDERPSWRIEKCQDYFAASDWRLGATPDFWVWNPEREQAGVLQGKTVALPEFKEKWQDGPPRWIVLQTLQEMLLTDASWGAIAALVIGTYSVECHIYPIERHPNAEAKIIRTASSFWQSVAAGEAPSRNYARDGDILRDVYRKGGGDTVDLSRHNRIDMLCEEKLAWARRQTTAERALETIDAEIVDVLGAADRGDHPQYNITRKEQWSGGQTIPRQRVRVLRVTRKKAKTENVDAQDEAA